MTNGLQDDTHVTAYADQRFFAFVPRRGVAPHWRGGYLRTPNAGVGSNRRTARVFPAHSTSLTVLHCGPEPRRNGWASPAVQSQLHALQGEYHG